MTDSASDAAATAGDADTAITASPSSVSDATCAVPDNAAWLEEAKHDIDAWRVIMPADADGNPIDWDWVRGLRMADVTGALDTSLDMAGADSSSYPSAAADLHAALADAYATRERLEAIIAQCSSAFMGDFDRIVDSYRLPRALAYVNRRLNDRIAWLIRQGERHGLWKAEDRKQGWHTVTVLTPVDGGDPAAGELKDRTADILDARAARRKAMWRAKPSGNDTVRAWDDRAIGGSANGGAVATRTASDELMRRANLSAAVAPGGTPVAENRTVRASGTTGEVCATGEGRATGKAASDWRDAYLPGRDIATVMGIDIETTGTDPARAYIIDVGFEYMDMAGSASPVAAVGYRYREGSYEAGEAYGQARLGFGVSATAAQLGNPFIARLTGIDIRQRGPESGTRLFDEWPAAQRGLLERLVRQPYVAHNATFEHGFFMLNVAGYAEAWRDGRITIVDTLPMSRRWDPGSVPDEAHPYGDNTLEAYAKRQGALPDDAAERHLGLEDAHIMLQAMRTHLARLKAEGQGPWDPAGRSGVGGKRCGRR